MTYERVTFNEEVVKGMKKDDFIKKHQDVFWRHMELEKRKKMLGEVYDRIVPPRPAKKK